MNRLLVGSFPLALLSTMIGRVWQILVNPAILGPLQSAHWWFAGVMGVCVVVILLHTWKSTLLSRSLLLMWVAGMVVVLLVIPVMSVLNKPWHAYGVGKFAAQFLTPVLVAMVVLGASRQAIIRMGLIATSLCFALHGVLDLGIPATPAEYLRTSQAILGWGEAAVRRFLMVVGIADLVVAALIWWRPVRVPALAVAAAWGACAILARIIAYGHWDVAVAYREPWTYESLVRLPHFLVPLATCLLAWQVRRAPASDHLPVLIAKAEAATSHRRDES